MTDSRPTVGMPVLMCDVVCIQADGLCLCGNSTETLGEAETDDCDNPCSDDLSYAGSGSFSCGGAGVVSIYRSAYTALSYFSLENIHIILSCCHWFVQLRANSR